ncbi:hypothetical protein H4582DRAFT_2059600 [Lactarius indigo]|nr:hypothetical protein H4582DRAFT_2059600 [Lactarius indigo]
MAPVNRSDVHVLRALHEATLQDLLHAKNDAVIRLISERNTALYERRYSLCFWRQRLGGSPIEYSYHDFITPPNPPLPYIVVDHGSAAPARILQFHVTRPQWAYYPPDRRLFDACTQTNDDPDATLVEINQSTIDPEAVTRKRKRSVSA